MISLESKTQASTSSSPLSLVASEKEESPSLSFSELLKGIGSKKENTTVKDAVVVLALEENRPDTKTPKLSKSEILLSLLKGENRTKEEVSVLELNPVITEKMTPNELKRLVSDAKKYLKTKIIESEGFKKSEIEALPKTLKGLGEVAKKFGIDVSKITLEEVKPESKELFKVELKIDNKEVNKLSKEPLNRAKDVKVQFTTNSEKVVVEVDSKIATKKVQKVAPVQTQKVTQEVQRVATETPKVTQEVQKVAQVQTQTKVSQEVHKVAPVQTQTKVSQEVQKVAQVQTQTKVAQEVQRVATEMPKVTQEVHKVAPVQTQTKVAQEVQRVATETPKVTQEVQKVAPVQTQIKVAQEVQRVAPVQTQTKVAQEVQKVATETPKVAQVQTQTKVSQEVHKVATPLFKPQIKNEITTEQLVNTKINTIEVRTPKQKADETLKMLLRGDKVTQKEVGFTADFSVATARVIAPQATTDARQTLESLLRGDQSETTTNAKVDGLNVNKADSFEVKLNEAKQMTKYLSADVKNAIEEYKSPFTRVKVQLNPQRLGEIDLTIVQRGKNLHINLSSNNAAINALALNANDLKVQLTNNGINNASLNFNNSSQSSEQSFSGQQQQNSQKRETFKEYNYFDKEETNEELINSLEIVVPNYA